MPLVQDSELKKCSLPLKNVNINCYGNAYALETMLQVSSKLCKAHRYLTKSVHSDWPRFADLDGPNIRSRRLYTEYGLDSIEVIHRRRRNFFLIKSAAHENKIISGVIGSLERITV